MNCLAETCARTSYCMELQDYPCLELLISKLIGLVNPNMWYFDIGIDHIA